MYKCLDCGHVFEEPRICYEDLSPGHSSEGSSFELKYYGCPVCKGDDFKEMLECIRCAKLTIDGIFCKGIFWCNDCAKELGLKSDYRR